MNEFMKILLSMSVSGTLLLLLVSGLKLLYKNKFSRRWQYYIWIIVVFRFLLPFTPTGMNIGNLFEKFNTAVITNEIFISPNISVTVNTDGNETKQIPPKTQTNENVMVTAVADNFLDIYTCIFFVWSTTALVLFGRKIIIYQEFIRYIKAANKEVSDIKILNLLSDCKEKLKIKTWTKLYHNTLITSPIMIGFFHPSIILPVGGLEDKELSYIFVHELLHYKQRDMFYKWLIQIVICIHWFNPFVYLLEKEVNKACELSCDEAVISVLDDKARREYGDTLIYFLKSTNLCKGSFTSVTLTEGAEQLKERLGAIMNIKKKSRGIRILMGVVTLCIIGGAAFVGVYPVSAAGHSGSIYDGEITNVSYMGDEEIPKLTGEPLEQEEISVTNTRKWDNNKNEKSMLIIHESAAILHYENGCPYIHDILTNNTNKTIIETEYCMLAFNENGSPLKLCWNFLDSSTESSYQNLVQSKENILSNQTENYHGGWTLYDGELMENTPKGENVEDEQVAYSLICLKQVVFEDGTIWNNPDYEDWFETYAGKEVSVAELENYYPHEYKIEYN